MFVHMTTHTEFQQSFSIYRESLRIQCPISQTQSSFTPILVQYFVKNLTILEFVQIFKKIKKWTAKELTGQQSVKQLIYDTKASKLLKSKKSQRALKEGLVKVTSQGQGSHRIVSSTFQIVQILVQSHFELVSSVQALEATEPVSEPVTQMAVELINNHLISVQQKR